MNSAQIMLQPVLLNQMHWLLFQKKKNDWANIFTNIMIGILKLSANVMDSIGVDFSFKLCVFFLVNQPRKNKNQNWNHWNFLLGISIFHSIVYSSVCSWMRKRRVEGKLTFGWERNQKCFYCFYSKATFSITFPVQI